MIKKATRLAGIIGGAGPGATASLYLDILNRCSRAELAHRPPILIASLDIDLSVEERLLREGVGVEHYLDSVMVAARALVTAGADFLAMPCNTLHVLMPELAAAVPVPIISIVDAVADDVGALGCQTVGLLATTSTVHSRLYSDGLQAHGVSVVGIGDELQEILQECILDEVEQCGSDAAVDLGRLVIERFASQGVCAIVAGCTELKAVMAGWPTIAPVIDSLETLAAHVTAAILGQPVDRG